MKKIFTYLGLFLSVVLIGALTSCNPREIDQATDLGLGIKVFFPTKVVAGQPMTINGSGLSEVREIVFPDGVSVTSFEHVGNDMIRVIAPSGIAASGGKLIVVSADDQAESKQDLTLGSTVISGFSKQDGEEINGAEQLTIFGKDLEFISRIELLDTDGNPLILEDEDFYRKGTSTVIFTVPKTTIFDGTFVGKVYTFDGKVFSLPELTYKPVEEEQGGHWETVETIIWENPGAGAVGWNGTYRFALEGHDGNSECIAEIPQDIWDKMMTETFYLTVEATDPQIRVTNGWWDSQWLGDFQPGNERLTDNGDGTWTLEINFADAADYVATLEQKHILFTGDRYTPIEIYFAEEIWVDGGGGGPKQEVFWENPGAGGVSWNGTYRFGLDGNDGNNECIATFPEDIWNKIKSGPFYIELTPNADWFNVRVTNGWWDTSWNVGDVGANNERMVDNGDGTFHIEINISDDADFLATVDQKHILFTGEGYTPNKLYFQ